MPVLAVALGHVKELHIGGVPLHLLLEHARVEHQVLQEQCLVTGWTEWVWLLARKGA